MTERGFNTQQAQNDPCLQMEGAKNSNEADKGVVYKLDNTCSMKKSLKEL